MPAPPGTRLFVGLALPDGARAGVAHLAERVATSTGGRPVPAENLHLTLDFLGAVPPAALPALRAAVRAALAGPAIPLGPSGLRAHPRGRRARLVALELDDPLGLLAERAARVRAAVDGVLGRAPDPAPLWPHVTLVRLRRPGPVDALPAPGLEPFVAVRGALLDSHARPGGPPLYREVAAVDLGASL